MLSLYIYLKTKWHLAYVLFSLLTFLSLGAFAQKIINSTVSVKAIVGTHAYQDQGHLFQDKIYGIDMAYLTSVSEKNTALYSLTKIKNYGLEFTYRDLSLLKGIKDTSAHAFGQMYGLAAQANFELFAIGKLKIIFAPSIGLSYTNKTFFTNQKNRFTGSHFNEQIKADIGIELPFGQNTDLLVGAGMLHASNGGAVIPNGGLNTLHLYAGVNLNGQQNKATPESQNKDYTLKRSFIELSVGAGKRGVFEDRTKKLYKTGLYGGYNCYLNSVFSLKAGLDAVYYFTVYNPNNNTNTFQYYATSLSRWRVGTSIGADANLWKFTLSAQVGKYIYYNNLYDKVNWYWAFGPTFNLSPRIGLQAKTYLHFFQADYINYGINLKL